MEPRHDTSVSEHNSVLRTAAQTDLARLSEAKFRILNQKAFECQEISSRIPQSNIFQRHKMRASSFGYSLRSFLLYAQIGDRELRSPGLFLVRGDSSFALGLFSKEGKLSAHIIAPQGCEWQQNICAFSTWLLQNFLVDRVYIRHLTIADALDLERLGFQKLVHSTAWCKAAPFEDETFNHRVLNLRQLVSLENGKTSVKNLNDGGSSNFRSKFRPAFQRGQNFLNRNNLTYTFRPIAADDIPATRQLIQDHFGILENSQKAVGSCALDYELLLTTLLADSPRYVSVVGVLRSGEKKLISSIFLAERTGYLAGGLYCSITNRSPVRLKATFPFPDLTGFTALPQYALASLFGELLRRGWEQIDLGGSETEDLDRFKRQMGAQNFETTWRVMQHLDGT